MGEQKEKRMKKQEKKTGLKEILKGGQETLPGFQFQIYRAEDKRSLWNADFEILFLLKGDGRVSYEDGVVYRVQEKDLFVVNGFQICSIDLNAQGILLSLKMSADAIASVHIEFLKYEIECRSFLFMEEQQETFDVIRSDLARVFQEAYKNDMMQPVNARSRITALLEDLSRYFAVGERVKHSRSGRERIQMASDYILQHYKEAITLEDLADHIYLSRTYISRSFPRYFGVSFLEYITQVRLAHAILDMHGDATLTEIAYNNGFSNENVMIRAFRKYFGMTPGEYRKSIVQTAVREEEKNCGLIKYIDRTTEDYEKDNDVYRVLLQYAGFREQEFDAEKENSVQILAALGGRKQRIAGHWRRIINGGYARSVLDARVQEELAQAIRDIGYEFIRVKGILDDDMCVLRRDMKGEIRVGYQYIDAVLDFILSIGAKPMIEFGHMPGLLAEQPSQITMRPVQNAAPKDLEAWKRLIGGIMDHLRTRYGVERMRNWIWVPWVNTDFFENCGMDRYIEVYRISHQEIKRICPDFLTCLSYGTMGEHGIKELLLKMEEAGCLPEIYGVRSFGAVMPWEEQEDLNLIVNSDSFDFAVSRDMDYLQNYLRKIRKRLQKMGFQGTPIIVDECSNNVWQRDLCNDTCYKAAWLFKNMLENENEANGLAYFSINDRLDEIFPVHDSFHGGFGMFTDDGIPKAVYGAAKLLGKMGTRFVASGKGYFISTEEREEKIQIYLYNYVHYDMLYRHRHTVNISRTDRYRVFQAGENLTFSVQLQKVPGGEYRIQCYKITREQGSPYDCWAAMGAPEAMTSEEKEMICHSADPEYRVWRETVGEEQILSVQEHLKVHEVACIEIICLNHYRELH